MDATEPVEWCWMRVYGRLGDNVESHLASIAYMSDIGLLDPSYRAQGGLEECVKGMSIITSLDHSIWFHSHNFRADEWLLWELRCIQAGCSRILCTSQAWSSSGQLILSCTQEGLGRPRPVVERSSPSLRRKLASKL